MFSRALLVALCIGYSTSLTPLAPLAAADDDCALYLTGPGRSSAYDYSLNLLKGNFAYDGQHTCITYDAINQAYLDARTRILVSQPKGDWKAEDFASVGELILDISISLARTYGLSYEEIEKGLPLIDTSRTLIREVCPPVFSHVECRAGKYRRLDGLCNNLKHPTWGATMAPFQRLIGPLFSDGINAPRISHSGHDLPLSRVVSRTMHPDEGFHDHAGTVMVIAWGQFMDHDYTLTGTPLDPVHRNDPEECCKRPPHLKHPYCNEIRIPDDDYFYRLFGVKCIDFVRGFPSPRPGCRLGSRIPFNTLTGAIDGNTVYGVTEKFARKLRTGFGGLLRMNPVFKEYGLKDLLPLKLDIPDEGCTRPNKNMYCFEAGEIRVNEQLVLTVMHTLMAREHNRVAEALAHVNPHWDDETLFQEARRINIAEIQHITYNEFLPILLGKDVMEKFGLVLAKEGYWDGYDQEVNPDVIASFAAAAYRFGHSLLPTAVERWSKAHKFIASKRLSDLIRRPYDLYRAGVLDEYVMGLMNQVAQAMDDSITQEVTNHLFKKVGARFGMDLVSFNMQRGREFGLPGYMEFRKFCGLSGAETFQDLFGSMPNDTIRKYESIFEHPIDVDLWSGGVSERPLPGSMLGPTFACIIATQFSYSRRGDRFWFELPNQPSSFTPEQLVEIRKSRLARVICDNTDIIDTVQLYPMVLPDHELNPRVPCRSGIIPSMDFSKWADPVPFIGGAKEYMTDAHIFNGTTTQNNESQKICNNVNGLCASNKTTHTNSMKNQTRNFSDSEKDKEMSKLCLQAENSTVCLNNTNQTDCNEKNCSTVALNRDENLINKMQKNTMSKYVLNNKATEKLKGHFKNSLKRKRRSFTGNIENNKKPHVPGIYEVIEDQNKERGELNLPKFEPSEIIKNTDILEFPVETLRKTEKPHYNKLQKGEPRRYHPKNNDQYFHKSEIREDTDGASDENSSQDHQYRDDEYETLREKITQKGARDLPVNLNRRHHLPKTTEVIEESAEVNIREKPEREDLITYRDANDDRHDKNYRSGERLHEDIKSSNNDSPRESIRSYADNYKISNDEQSENDSEEIINKNYSSLEDEEEDEEDSKDVRFHENQKQTSSEGRKQEYHNENTKNINKDQFSYEDDENDEEPSRNLKKNENLQVPNNNLRTQNNKFYNGINPSPASKKSGNFKDEKDERSEDSEEDEGEDDDDKPLGNFKKEENVHVNKPPVSHTLEGHHQKYNDEYFSLAPKRPNKDNENYKKDEENDDDDSTENLNIDREHREYLQPQINFKNKNYAEGSKKSAKKIDDNNEKRDSYKEKQGQENVKHDVSIHEYKKPNLISQKQSQFFNNDNNGYSLLQPKKLNEELNERQRPNKENGFNVNTGTIKSFSREVDLPTVTEKNTPLLSYRTDSDSEADSEKSQENNSRLKYASQPIDISGTVGRPDIQIKASIENGIRHLLTSDRPIYANTDFGSNFHDNFTDNKQKETTIPNDNYNENPSLYRKQVQKSLENSKAVQEVDLSNFSYDKFRGISDVDEFEPVTHKEEASTIKPKIKKKNRKNANIRKSNKNKPIHIHVPKPVKYVSNENIKEENKRHYNEDLSDNYQRTTSKGGKHRKSNSNKKTRNPKVKSLNYNQAAAKSDTSDKVTESEGTLDTLSPNTNEFDENLKIKFGDVNIKLPEIKLPKDILSYSNEDQVSKDKIKSKHYTYAPLEPKQKSQGNTESINPYDPTDAAKYSEQQKPKGDKPADEYDFFASYINKPHEGSHSDDAHNGDIEDGEDLYERFVRERFGRKDSFKERSEKLKEKKDSENKPITKNKELFDNIQKAIKRAEEVQKEAQKSKDPKANYLWTLEYGEKL